MFTPLPAKIDGDGFTEALWDQLVENHNRGVMRPLATTLLASSAASITFSGIAGSWLHLCLMLTARGTNASGFVNLTVRFNGDAGANYDTQHVSAAGTTSTAAEALASTGFLMAGFPAASAPAGRFGSLELWVPGYASTDREKVAVATNGRFYDDTTTNFATQQGGCWWRSTAAITEVAFSLSAGSFAAGTRATLYALGG